MWWLLLIYFALNIVITAVTLVINWHFVEWTAKDIVSIVAMVLFGVPILVFGLIYCYILGRKELKMTKIDEKCENCGYFEKNNHLRWCNLYDMFIEGDGDACDEFENK